LRYYMHATTFGATAVMYSSDTSSFTAVWVACSHPLIPDTHLARRHISRLHPNSASYSCP